VAAAEKANAAVPSKLLGRGVLALTIDQGEDMTRYQGVVSLEGETLEQAAHTYFRQSEQIPTKVRLAAAELMVREGGKMRRHWRAGGLMAQFIPAAPERLQQKDLPGGDVPEGTDPEADDMPEDDAWTEAQSLVGTIEDHELLDRDVPVERLLYRLFHERGVRVFDPVPVRDKCSCSRKRIRSMLAEFSAEAIEESIEDGKIRVTCEFCGKKYNFDPAEFRADAPIVSPDGDVADDPGVPRTGE
jgi:molecular chaperone Hsp33